MQHLIASIGLSILGACVIAALVRGVAREPVNGAAFAGAVLALLFYCAAIVLAGQVQGLIPGLSGLKWNWVGKIVATSVVLAAIAAVPLVGRAEVGLQVRLKPGSVVPALIATAILCLLAWGQEIWAADGRELSRERLAFQLLMPGLDEELFFRGLLLALLLRAFRERWSLFGAPVGPAAAVVTFIFAALHGLRIAEAQLVFDAEAFAVAGALGFGLLWIRQRTGSVLPAIAAHNLINFGNSFF